jgi:hypothetical protein
MNAKYDGKSQIALTLLFTVMCFLSSCPNPITTVMVTHVKDKIPPVVVITSPAAGTLCANIVEIDGKATDAATLAGNDGHVSSLSYAVSGSTVSGTIAAASDGTFSFQFSTVTLGTNFTLSITAVDWNLNSTVASLPLQKQTGNGIPSFAVAPGNQRVTVTWSSVPHTTSYTLYYTTNGSLPSDQIGQKIMNAASPCSLPNLPNGNMCVFQLKAVPESGWPESLSDYIQAIPLSPQTLAPWATGGFQSIRIEWSPIPATTEYEVWRSTDQNGTYNNLSGPINGTSYVDANLSDHQFYWYKVKPSQSGSILSFANCAQTDPFHIHHPLLLGSCSTTAAHAVAVNGSFAYVADETVGLRIIDISNPARPTLRGTYSTYLPVDVAVSGSLAYVADVTEGLLIIDVSDPSAPALMGACPNGGAWGVAISASGNYAFIADSDAGVQVIDVHDPSNPQIVETYNPDNMVARRVAVSGSNLFVADAGNGLTVINVSTPTAPSLECVYHLSSDYGLFALDIAVRGVSACLADGYAGVRLFDISDPANPVLESTYRTGYANGVAISGSYMFVADQYAGLEVIDISNPVAPAFAGNYPNLSATGVVISGSCAYVADGTLGLSAIDISSPGSPSLAVAYSAVDATELAISGSYAYLVLQRLQPYRLPADCMLQ